MALYSLGERIDRGRLHSWLAGAQICFDPTARQPAGISIVCHAHVGSCCSARRHGFQHACRSILRTFFMVCFNLAWSDHFVRDVGEFGGGDVHKSFFGAMEAFMIL